MLAIYNIGCITSKQPPEQDWSGTKKKKESKQASKNISPGRRYGLNSLNMFKMLLWSSMNDIRWWSV